MKKTKKMFLTLALIFGFGLLAPTLASFRGIASAETITQDYYFQITQFSKTATVGLPYTLADGTIFAVSTQDEIAQATITVRNPYGAEVEVEGKSFLVEHFGRYTVEYKYNDETQVLSFLATEGKYAFKFEENSKQIIPTIMNMNADKDVVLPNPTIVDENGDVVEIPEASLNITVKNPNHENVVLTDVEGGFKSFKPNTSDIWTVRYEYRLSSEHGNKVLVAEEREINVDNSYQNEYDLKLSLSTPPTTADTKTEVTLPVATVTNKITNNSVNFYLEIKAERVVYNENEEQKSRVDVTAESINGRIFTPQVDGTYVITYKVSDFFGNSITKEITEIRDVKDNKAPVIKIVAPYAQTPETLADYSHNIPSKAVSTNFTLPAIWAEDNVDKTLEDLTLTRKIRRSGTFIFNSSENPNKELVFNADMPLTENQVAATLDGENEFAKGTYSIVYIATDKAGNESVTEYFTVEIDNDFQEGENPEIKWSTEENLPTRIRLGETLKFAAPVSTHETHARIATEVEYALADTDTLNDAISEDTWTLINLEDKSVYEIEVPESVEATVKTIRIRAKAYTYKGESEYIYATVNIFETQDSAPVVIQEVDMSGLVNIYKQGHDIKLGKFVFADDLINFVSLEVLAYAQTGQRVSVVNGTRTVSGDTLTFENAKFFASFAGDYTITVKATDINGSTAIYNFVVNVAEYVDQIEPHFSTPKTVHDGVIELGTVIKMPEATIAGVEVQPEYTVEVIEGPMNYRINDYEFEAFEEGFYTIQYKTTVGEEEITATFQVEVADKIAPEIAGWENIKAVNFPSKLAKGTELQIPVVGFTTDDVDRKNSKVEVRRGNQSIKNITIDELTPTLTEAKINLSQDADYTIIYTIKDFAKTPNTRTYEAKISVGDTIKPVIKVDEKTNKLVEETVKIGKNIDLDLSTLTITDAGKGELEIEDLEVIMRHNGNELSNRFGEEEKSRYGYVANQAGSYTLTIRIRDEAGNWSETTTRTINVTEKENTGVETTEVIGLVLIIVSALILAGAIVYFTISKRKADEYKIK